MSILFGSGYVFISQTRSILLNVYLNYNFELSLLSSYSFFNLFNLKGNSFHQNLCEGSRNGDSGHGATDLENPVWASW